MMKRRASAFALAQPVLDVVAVVPGVRTRAPDDELALPGGVPVALAVEGIARLGLGGMALEPDSVQVVEAGGVLAGLLIVRLGGLDQRLDAGLRLEPDGRGVGADDRQALLLPDA